MKVKIFSIVISVLLLLDLSSAYERTVEMGVPAVNSLGVGTMTKLKVEIVKGKGRVLLNSEPLTGMYTQNAERKAVRYAEKYLGINMSNYDVIFTFEVKDAEMIDGPSAGAAMTVAVIAALENRTIRKDLTMTGTIEMDGTIGEVGGILQKAQAAERAGYRIFLIPEGEELQRTYVKKVKEVGGIKIVTVKPIDINVTEYAKKHWGLVVKQISTIDEAVEYAFGEKNISTYERKKRIFEIKNVTLKRFIGNENYGEFRKFSEFEISKAEKELEVIKLKNKEIKGIYGEYIERMIENGEDLLNNSKYLLSMGYYYSSANDAFRALITFRVAKALVDTYDMDENERKEYLADIFGKTKLKLENTIKDVERKTEYGFDERNFEYTVFARKRAIYAYNRIKEIEESGVSQDILASQSYFRDTLFNIFASDEWCNIAELFANQVKGKKKMPDHVKNIAESTLDKMSEETAVATTISEDYSLKEAKDGAEESFKRGWYLTSIFLSLEAMVRANVSVEYNLRDIGEILAEYNSLHTEVRNIMSAKEYDYAQYLFYKATTFSERDTALEALVHLKLSKQIAEIEKEYAKNLGIKTNINIKKVGILAVLICGVAILVIFKKRHKIERMTREKVEYDARKAAMKVIREHFERGEIDFETYDKLMRKFSNL